MSVEGQGQGHFTAMSTFKKTYGYIDFSTGSRVAQGLGISRCLPV